MSAVRQFQRKSQSTPMTSPQPISNASSRLLMERSMKSAGRKMCESKTTSRIAGATAASTSSTRRVISSVLPQGCFSTISSRPGTSLMTASPMGGANVSVTFATSLTRSTAPLRLAMASCPS